MEILAYNPAFAPDFERLNRAWIERYFQLERPDLEVFARPESIITSGGMISFARVGRMVVGTGALIKHTGQLGEIAKMAVDDAFQSRGIGQALLETLIAGACERGFQRLEIETSSRLPSAIRLYRRVGFRDQEKRASHHGFGRADVFLELELQAEPVAH